MLHVMGLDLTAIITWCIMGLGLDCHHHVVLVHDLITITK